MRTLKTIAPWQRAYLDLLRCLGAQLVMLGHASYYFLNPSFLSSGYIQGLGVQIFFLISGFLISHTVLDNYDNLNYSFWDYFIQRFCRIYAAYFPALLLVAVIDDFSMRSANFDYGSDYNLYTWIGNLFMLQDYPLFAVLRRLNFGEQSWFIAPFGSARPFWTITIEWWLYIVFGCAVFFCVKRADQPGRWPMPILAAVSIVPLYNFCGGYAETLIYLWIFGMCIAIGELRWWRSPRPANRQPDGRFVQLCLAVAGFALFCMLARMAGRGMTGGEIPFGVMMTAMIFALYFALGHTRRQVPRLVERVISFTAGYSYSLYLIHNSIIVLCATQFFPTGWNPKALVTVVVLSHVASIVFWFLFERHHRMLARLVRQALLRGSAARPLPAAPELTGAIKTAGSAGWSSSAKEEPPFPSVTVPSLCVDDVLQQNRGLRISHKQ